MADETHVLREAHFYDSGKPFQVKVSFFGDNIMRIWHSSKGDPVLDQAGQIKLLRLLLKRYPLEILGDIRDEPRPPDQD